MTSGSGWEPAFSRATGPWQASAAQRQSSMMKQSGRLWPGASGRCIATPSSRGLEAVLAHDPERLRPGSVDAGHELFRSPGLREGIAGRQQAVEVPGASGPGRAAPNLMKVAPEPASLPAALVADRESDQLAALAHQHRLADTLVADSADLALHVEPGIDRLGQRPAGRQGRRPRRPRHGREGRPLPTSGGATHGPWPSRASAPAGGSRISRTARYAWGCRER